MFIEYELDGKKYQFDVGSDQEFYFGEPLVLSTKDSDISYGQSWYEEGYGIVRFLSDKDFSLLYRCLSDCVKNIIEKELGVVISDFVLEKYHRVIRNDEAHFRVVSKTRDLFSFDLNFNLEEIISRFNKILGFNLTDKDDIDGNRIHIVVRINRPGSNDFNPPHKDTYEAYDERKVVSKFMNFWIPICGVTSNSSLPLSPRSHLIPESRIERTIIGGVIHGNKYRVRLIKSWDCKTSLIRPKVNYGELIMFSSQLVHGLAVNAERDLTRVALEFRLFKE